MEVHNYIRCRFIQVCKPGVIVIHSHVLIANVEGICQSQDIPFSDKHIGCILQCAVNVVCVNNLQINTNSLPEAGVEIFCCFESQDGKYRYGGVD